MEFSNLAEQALPKVVSGTIKLLTFEFVDPYEDLHCFETLETQLASYFSQGWDWFRGSMTPTTLRTEDSPHGDHAPWGLALFSLRFNPANPPRHCCVKVLPIVFRDAYATNLADGEKWLTAYLNQGWELLADFIFTGIVDGDSAASTWGISFMLLRRYLAKNDPNFIPHPQFFCSGAICPQNMECHFCNY